EADGQDDNRPGGARSGPPHRRGVAIFKGRNSETEAANAGDNLLARDRAGQYLDSRACNRNTAAEAGVSAAQLHSPTANSEADARVCFVLYRKSAELHLHAGDTPLCRSEYKRRS